MPDHGLVGKKNLLKRFCEQENFGDRKKFRGFCDQNFGDQDFGDRISFCCNYCDQSVHQMAIRIFGDQN